jgi:uncharacterized membrane protein YdjX (TVP38/TMEM64 family)
MQDNMGTKAEIQEAKPRVNYTKWLRNSAILILIAGIFLVVYKTVPAFKFNIDYISNILAHMDLERLKWYLRSFGVWAPIISALIMIFESVMAPLPAFVVTLTNGLLFGAFWGTLLSWSSAMVGAIICFYISRWLGRPAAERFVSKRALKYVDGYFKRYGNNSILLARLLPFVSFDAVSYMAGLTSISFWGFFWSTGLGQLPATIVYSWLGQNISTIAKFWFWALLGVLSLVVFAVTIKKAIDTRMANKIKKDDSANEGIGTEQGVRP